MPLCSLLPSESQSCEESGYRPKGCWELSRLKLTYTLVWSHDLYKAFCFLQSLKTNITTGRICCSATRRGEDGGDLCCSDGLIADMMGGSLQRGYISRPDYCQNLTKTLDWIRIKHGGSNLQLSRRCVLRKSWSSAGK